MNACAIRSIVVAILVVSALGVGAQAPPQHEIHAPPRYSIQDLGDLGGGFSAASGVNNEGVVDGTSGLPGGEFRAFRWRDGVMTDLGTLGGVNSNAQDQPDSSGTITGMAETATPDPNGEDFCSGGTNLICVPYVWKKGVMSALPLPGGNNGVAFQANSRGDIVGAAESAVPDPTCQPPFYLRLNAVIWEKGHLRVLPPLAGDTNAAADSINNKGQVVGNSGDCTIPFGNSFHAVIWENGTAVDLGNLGGTTGNLASMINDRGQVVGQSGTGQFVHGFLWENGKIKDLGILPGSPISQALGINNKGQIVGFAQDANGDESSSIALLWQDGVLIDLNTLIPPDSPWFLQEAFSINERGQIAGHMVNTSTGQIHAFLATPVETDGNAAPSSSAQLAARRPPATVLSPRVRMLLRQARRFRYGGAGQ